MVSRDLWRTSVTPHKASTSPEVSTSQPSTRTSSGISPPPKAYGWVEAVGAIWASCRPVPQVRFRWCECWKWTVNESNILLEVRLAHCLNFWFFYFFCHGIYLCGNFFFFYCCLVQGEITVADLLLDMQKHLLLILHVLLYQSIEPMVSSWSRKTGCLKAVIYSGHGIASSARVFVKPFTDPPEFARGLLSCGCFTSYLMGAPPIMGPP